MPAIDTSIQDGFDDSLEPRKFDWATACIAGVCFFSFMLWIGVAGQYLFYVPRSQRLFDDFKMMVPLSTELVFHHSWWLIPTLILATLVVCLATRSRWSWLLLLIVLPLAINAFVFVSMFLPTEALLDALRR